jgi:hypothetical protein
MLKINSESYVRGENLDKISHGLNRSKHAVFLCNNVLNA